MSDAYDMIDRFLRNNLGDDDYADFSAALDSLCVATPQQAEAVPKKDLMFSTVAMQTRHDKRIERIVNMLEQVKQEQAERYQPVREAF